MLHRIVLAIVAIVAAINLHGQMFEVVSLKPTVPGSPPMIGPAPGGERYHASGVTLKTMIQTAYHVRADQIAGGPYWLDRTRFDLEAKAERPSGAPELRAMLRNLLVERFRLELRTDTKDMPVYVLSVDKGGPKLTPHDAANAGEAVVDLKTVAPLHLKVTGTSASMELFAYRMGYLLDRPMVDRTGIKGDYDFSFEYTMEAPDSMHEGIVGHNGQPIDFSGPTIFAALRKEMGLRLEAGKGPVEALLITRAEIPQGN